jgi:cytochrome c-type biogenesis protein CcmH/NrfG
MISNTYTALGLCKEAIEACKQAIRIDPEKEKIKGRTSKMLEVVLEEKRREIIKEWINSGRIEV